MVRPLTHRPEVQEAMLRIATLVKDNCKLSEAFRREHAAHPQLSVHSLERYWYNRRNKEIRAAIGRVGRFLDPEQEALLVAFIQGFSRANWPLLPGDIRRLIKLQWDITVNKQWMTRFLKRHKNVLSKRVCKALSDKRASIETLEDVEAFIREFSDRPAYPRHAIMNVDETRLNYRSNGYAFQRVGAADRQKHNLTGTRKGKGGTLVSVVAADGTVFMSLWIFTGTPSKKSGELTEMPPEEEEEPTVVGSAPIAPEGRTRSEVHPRYYAFNETGYMDGSLWRSFGREDRGAVEPPLPRSQHVLALRSARCAP
jgi:transposase